jgi:dienelactone hydrolase
VARLSGPGNLGAGLASVASVFRSDPLRDVDPTARIVAAEASSGGFPRFGRGCTRADFKSRGRTVRAEFCRAARGSGAAVVVLHGCGGFSTFDHRIVTGLPAYGVSTLDVDYFGLTPPAGDKGFCDSGGRAFNVFGVWTTIAIDAAAKLRQLPGVRHVGIVGWSLGGGVAVRAAVAAHSARPFGALVGFSTGAFGAESVASELPPTMLLSGGSTDAIPLQETLPLYQALKADHVPTVLFVYPHGSHNWPGRQGRLGIEHAAAFLRRHL